MVRCLSLRGLRVPPQDNRDMRVALLQDYARRFFPATRYLDYALRVERYTLTKAANLVLNVDGCIGALFLDLLHSSSMFTTVSSSPHCSRPCCQEDVADTQRWQSSNMLLLPEVASSYHVKLAQAHNMLLLGLRFIA